MIFVPHLKTSLFYKPYSENILNNSVAWYTFNGNSNDSSTYGSTATLINSPTYSNNAILLNGTNQYIDCGASSQTNFTTSDFSISFWIKMTTLPPSANVVVVYRGEYQLGGYYLDINSSGGIDFATNVSGTSNIASSSSSLVVAGIWYYITVIKQGSTQTIYLNTNSVASGTALNPVASDTDLFIGSYFLHGSTTFSNYVSGAINDFKIYGRALSTSEILYLYHKGAQ